MDLEQALTLGRNDLANWLGDPIAYNKGVKNLTALSVSTLSSSSRHRTAAVRPFSDNPRPSFTSSTSILSKYQIEVTERSPKLFATKLEPHSLPLTPPLSSDRFW
ncbi:hypothetical protein V6N11_076897 [Hibiscus sabdariffa]|uniref:Uncharacterized protein n=1 Tax=Hibiscus sabdariffa TaxID=183260 RepID=A0ABR2TBJ3_9ROSI